jgi:16S rRNA (guanine(966)-N(2))-methyltransferase RsmD
MRIISGKYKGKKIELNIDTTRPTMDRVKESLFGTIQNYVKDSIVLDLFAGSGNVGYEFLSNGSKSCYFIDNNPKVIEALNKVKKELNEVNAYIIRSDFKDYLNSTNVKFDIIFLDPPYQNNFITPAVKLIKEKDLLNKGGIIICEYEKEIIDTLDYEVIKEKRYGSKNIMILKKIS